MRSSQWYHARLVPLLAWHPAREPDVENQVPPPDVKPPFALIAAQPSAPAPPYTCRVQPKHQCIASRTHPARPGPLPRPEHARTHANPRGASHRGCARFRSGSATPGVSGDDFRRYLYVHDGLISTVPCTSCVAAVCCSDLVSGVVFSRVAGVWPMVARVCCSSV